MGCNEVHNIFSKEMRLMMVEYMKQDTKSFKPFKIELPLDIITSHTRMKKGYENRKEGKTKSD